MRERKRERLSAIAVMVLLNGCIEATSSGTSTRPSLTEYPRAFQAQAAAELAALPLPCPLHAPRESCSVVARLVEDYGELRARLRE